MSIRPNSGPICKRINKPKEPAGFLPQSGRAFNSWTLACTALATFALLIAPLVYAEDDAPNPAPRDAASGLPTGKRQHKPANAVPVESTAEKADRKLATRPTPEVANQPAAAGGGPSGNIGGLGERARLKAGP